MNHDNHENRDKPDGVSAEGRMKFCMTVRTRNRALALSRLACALVAMVMVSISVQAATGTRRSDFEYYPVGHQHEGLLAKEIIEPNNAQLCLVNSYEYDNFGNRKSATTSNCPGASGDAVITTRSSTTSWGADTNGTDARFPTKSKNALNHQETKLFDARFGAPSQLTGPNGLITSWQYDTFGREKLEIRSDNTKTQTEYLTCGVDATCTAQYSKYVVVTTQKGVDNAVASAVNKVYFDSLNREVRSETQGFDGKIIYRDMTYDSLGRLSKITKPYYPGIDTPVGIDYTYDNLGRVKTANQPATTSGRMLTTNDYNGLAVTVTVSDNSGVGGNLPGVTQTKTTTANAVGQTVTIADTQLNNLTYAYDPFGNLLQTNAAGVVTAMFYDNRGRKTSMIDPNSGTLTYTYNVLDELIRQTDAKSQTTTMVYDVLGRMTQRNEPDLVSKWFYDIYPTTVPEWDGSMLTGVTGNCSLGTGKLCYASSDNGYRRLMSYETAGSNSAARGLSTRTKIGNAYYTVTATYQANTGRLNNITYPVTNFQLQHQYTPTGYLQSVAGVGTGITYWRATELTATDQVIKELTNNGQVETKTTYDPLDRPTLIEAGKGGFGTRSVQISGYAYDAVGNTTRRSDGKMAIDEGFVYDPLNRLRQVQNIYGGANQQLADITYSAQGNILSKTGDASYGVGTYTYANVSGIWRPQVVVGIQAGSGALGGTTYSYDANGNMNEQKYPNGTRRVDEYTSNDLLRKVTNFSNGSLITGKLEFLYNSERQRVREYRTLNGASVTTDMVHPDNAGGLLFEAETTGSGVRYRHFINGGSGVAAVYTTGVETKTDYWHRDPIGSVVVMTNASGDEISGSRRSYNAWGRPSVSGDDYRGFTEQEHYDSFGIVHMNGRAYDPILGRFMGADPQVQSPENVQSYNRYAYGWNNPLGGRDPTGYEWESFGGDSWVFAPGLPSYGGSSFGGDSWFSPSPGSTIWFNDSSPLSSNQNATPSLNVIFSSLSNAADSFFGTPERTIPWRSYLGGVLDGGIELANSTYKMARQFGGQEGFRSIEIGYRAPVQSAGAATAGYVFGFGAAGMVRNAGSKLTASLRRSQEHHICTDKCDISTKSGGPWTPVFKEFFDNAGLKLSDAVNKVVVAGHRGPHPEPYHKYLRNELSSAVSGLTPKTIEYRDAVLGVLSAIKTEATTVGSQVNRWLRRI